MRLHRLLALTLVCGLAAPAFAQMNFEGLDLGGSKKKKKPAKKPDKKPDEKKLEARR